MFEVRMIRGLQAAVATVMASLSLSLHAQSDITQPGDPIVPTSNNSPGSEGVANAIDNQPSKYLNFDRLNTGFTVTPQVGLTIVSGLTLTSANDAPERDPASFVLSGSYDGTNFTDIASGPVPAFPSRFFKNAISFNNQVGYLHYRLIFPEVAGPGGNSMQIAEVELLGVLAPGDVTAPGDPIVPTSNNSPGSEGAANAIDNQPTKYINFDRLNTGFTVTPSVGATLVQGLTLTSANDAPERDPATFRLEGSLDGTAFFEIASGPVPPFPARFHNHYIFFSNTQAYRTYRLIFPEVVGPGGNSMQIAEVELLGVVSDAPQDVTQPGDPIVPTSNNSPGSEGVANAIDNQPTKYLNFDRLNTGFTVTPQVGLTIVNGLTLTSANDAPERDPASFVLSGSYDGTNFTDIASGPVPAFPSRFFKNTILFNNQVGYLHYRLIFPEVVGPGGNSMQISEVELLGTKAPNGCPVAQGGSIFLNQDSSLSFGLSAHDPEGDSLQFLLTQDPAHGTVLVDAQTGAASYTPGTNYCGVDSFKFKVNDGSCDSAEATVLVRVNCCPTADPQSVAVDQNSQVNFQLQAADADGDPIQYIITQAPAQGTLVFQAQTGAASYAPGTDYCGLDSFKFRVNDGACDSPEATVLIVVRDPSPPEIINLRVDSPSLWPPNHSMREVTVEYELRENCPSPTVCFLTVTSNQPIKGTGDGDTAPDWEVLDAHHVRLRAERAGRGGARVYTITVTCMDDSGNSSSQSVAVLVADHRPIDAD